MYAVVGCGECEALWIVEGRPETSQCPRCGTRRAYEKRREFVTTDDEDHAREVRASMLAARQGEDEAFAALDSFGEMERRIEEAGVDDETYLAESGLDSEAIERAGDRAGPETGARRSREETLRRAIRELERPDESAIVEYASERGVPADDAKRAIRKLVRAGEVTESDGEFRLL